MSSTLRSVAPALGVLIVLCGLTFLPLFDPSRAFVSWDDTTNIVENEGLAAATGTVARLNPLGTRVLGLSSSL